MSLPDFQTLMLPTLKALDSQLELHVKEIRSHVAAQLELSDEDLREMLPSGTQLTFNNRVAWALSHMVRADLVLKTGRGIYVLTDLGKELLQKNPDRIDMKLLHTFPGYSKWRKRKPALTKGVPASISAATLVGDTPEEAFHRAAEQLREDLESDVLSRVRAADPAFLEQVVVNLLIAMGYPEYCMSEAGGAPVFRYNSVS